MKHKHIITMLVADHPGVLTRVAGLFARRGFNIDTITVGKTTKKGISKMMFTVIGDDAVIEQVEKQVNKLVDVIKVSKLMYGESIIRELCLIKVSISNEKVKDDIIKYANIYKSKIVDITPKAAVIETIGEPQKINSFIELLSKYDIREISRSGTTGIRRGFRE